MVAKAVRDKVTLNRMGGLMSMAYNLWWTWNPDAQEIFRQLSPLAWERSNHSAIEVLREISVLELAVRLHDKHLGDLVDKEVKKFRAYINDKTTWAAKQAAKMKGPVAYFSAEFGLHESIPIYSGGLGILSGDHVKSASDLGIPFVAISLFYRQGYFQQSLSADGWQQESNPTIDPNNLPFELVKGNFGQRLINSVQVGHSTVYYQAWRVSVGRATLYLLDTNLPENDAHFQRLTAQVYGGDTDTRIAQEIVLGMGGVRLLRSLGIKPSVYHMNEGHSAFLTLELFGEELKKVSDKKKAIDAARKQCIFTTHTPVPAGHDRFSSQLMETYFSAFKQATALQHEELMAFGRIHETDANEPFTMTVLALKMSRGANGVSELHGHVSREMWKDLYPGTQVNKVPIGHVTNGIHTPTWTHKRAHEFWTVRLGDDWTKKLISREFWKKMDTQTFIKDSELWALRYELRRELIEFIRSHAQKAGIPQGDSVLSPDFLTIGFARRFATYKRAPLIFRSLDRIVPVITNAERPVQFIFAGKAHPRDQEGKRFIQRIVEITRMPELSKRVVFIENYDMSIARLMVAGCDIWLNNPRRPLEASGTSGMKAILHGCLNLSIMDGWWREAYNGHNGWKIGDDHNEPNQEAQDEHDFDALYNMLVNEVIPEFYDRDVNGIPVRWIKRVRQSMKTLVPVFNTERMLVEYFTKYYKTR